MLSRRRSLAASHDSYPLFQQTQIFIHVNVVAEEVPVRTERLDTMMARYLERFSIERPFLKMDTQGHDLPVASGAGDQLKVRCPR
jgi:hypothetical protein